MEKRVEMILGDVVSGSKAIKLWTNSSPNANFSSQKIDVDLSKYEYALIVIKNHTSYGSESNPQVAVLVKVGSSMYNVLAGAYIAARPSTRVRSCNVDTSGVTFNDGYYNSNVDNSSVIPLHIFGVNIDGLSEYLNI